MGGLFGFFNHLSNHLGNNLVAKSHNQLAAKSINELMVHEGSAAIHC